MARPAYKPPTPEQARIAELQRQIDFWRDRAIAAGDQMRNMISVERVKSALAETAGRCRADGWKDGVMDALHPNYPDHKKTLDYARRRDEP